MAWVKDEELAVLLLDEKLNKSLTIPYSGHELATAIRKQRPDFPVFVVTTYPDDDDLLGAEGDLDAIVSRGDMGKKPEVYAKRFTRAGTRYVKQHEKDLARLSKLSSKIAQGLATTKETREAAALQTTLQLTFFEHAAGSASAGVDELEAAVEQAESLRKEMQASLRKKPAGKKAKRK